MPRYNRDYRQTLMDMGYFRPIEEPWSWQNTPRAKILQPIGAFIAIIGGLFLVGMIVIIALEAWGIIRI